MKITRSQIAHVFQTLLTNEVRKPSILTWIQRICMVLR